MVRPSATLLSIVGSFALAMMLALICHVASAHPDDILEVEPVALQNMFYYHPGETHTMRVYVSNEGTLMDSYVLSLQISDQDWAAVLDRFRIDDVPPGMRVPFNVSITAPLDAVEGDRASINLTARSVMSNKTDSLNFFAFVIVSREVDISCDDPIQEMGSGETISFLLNVTNTGDVKDSYEVEWLTSPYDAPWSAEISMRSFELGRKESIALRMNVTSPDDRAEDGSVQVTVKSTNSTQVADTVVLRCIVRVVWSASVQPGNGTLHVRPGVPEVLVLNLTQETNDRKGRDWRVDIDVTNSTWSVGAEPLGFVMAGPSVKSINVTITAPDGARPWDGAAMRVMLRCNQSPDQPLEAFFALQVSEMHLLTLITYAPQVSLWPGNDVDVGFKIKNSGNVAEIVLVDISPTEGLEFTTSIGAIEGPWFQYLPGEQAEITIHIVALASADGVLFPVVTVASSDTNTLTLHLLVSIPGKEIPVPAIRMSRATNDTILVEPRNQTIGVDMIIENLMRHDIEARLVATVSNPRCVATLPEDPVYIPAEGRGLRVALLARTDAPFGDYILRIEVDQGVEAPLVINFTVVGPDLKLSNVEVPARVLEGGLADVSMTVANVGRGRSDPTVLTVTDEGGKMVANPVPIQAIGPGSSINVIVRVLPHHGRQSFTLSVNPNNTMREDGNASNSHTFELEPNAPKDTAVPSLRVWVGAIVLVLLVLAIIALRMTSRERRSGSP